jgi:quercetin dioxygenase-like cupin family protein
METKVQEQALDPVKVSPQFHRVLFENDLVRVLEINVPPGAKLPIHFHPDYVSYALGSCRTRLLSPDGGIETVSIRTGEAVFRPSETHAGENVGRDDMHLLNIEFKAPRREGLAPTLPEPDLLKVAPQFCTVLLDNDRCRLLDIRFPSGQALGVHNTLDQVVYPLMDGTVRVTYADGIPQVMTLEKGKPFFVKASVVNVQNIGTSDVHVVKLDLKP